MTGKISKSTTGIITRRPALAGLALTVAAMMGALPGPYAAGPASAEYPERPIEMIVPWGAGGGTDAVGRIIAQILQENLGQPVNVVNRTGGSGVVGHTAIARAKPDGYTMGVMTIEIDMMHWQGLTELTYQDYDILGMVNADPGGLMVAEDSEWKDAAALRDAIKAAEPGSFKASGTGQGGIWHLALIGLLLDQGLAADAVTFVPSEGAAPGLQEMVAGGVDMTNNALGESKTMLDAGRAKALAVMGSEPDGNFPDVPTTKDELGSDYTMGVWRGIVGPAGLDENIVAEIECHVEDITQSEGFIKFMGDSGYGIKYRNAADFTAFAAEDDKVKGEVMTAAGLVK